MGLRELFELVVSLLRGLNGWMETAEWAMNALLDLFLHFVWSSVAGVLAFSLTYWITRLLYFCAASLLRSPTSPPTRVARSMIGFSWSAALCASLWAHLWWDRLIVL